MELWQAITERKSVRVFKPDPVPRELIEKVLGAGMLAPSSANMQPWDIVVIGGEEKDKLSQLLLQAFSDKGQDYDIEFPKHHQGVSAYSSGKKIGCGNLPGIS